MKAGLVLTDFPFAEKVISLNDTKAARLADLALCISDLNEAQSCMQMALEKVKNINESNFLFQMSIIIFLKSFTNNNGRSGKLDIISVLSGDSDGVDAFNFYKNLRDKNIAHDDNSLTQCNVGAVVNKFDNPVKIEKVVTMVTKSILDNVQNSINFNRLVSISLEFCEKEYDKLCFEITNELNKLSHADLVLINDLTYKKPNVDDVGKNR